MIPHERKYNVNGQSYDIEQLRHVILNIIDDKELSAKQIAVLLNIDVKNLQYVLLNMHTNGIVHINKSGSCYLYSKSKVHFLQALFHPFPDFSGRIKGIYQHTGDENAH